MGPPDVIPHTLSALGHIIDGIVGRALLEALVDGFRQLVNEVEASLLSRMKR
jgi:hypothetical protein